MPIVALLIFYQKTQSFKTIYRIDGLFLNDLPLCRLWSVWLECWTPSTSGPYKRSLTHAWQRHVSSSLYNTSIGNQKMQFCAKIHTIIDKLLTVTMRSAVIPLEAQQNCSIAVKAVTGRCRLQRGLCRWP